MVVNIIKNLKGDGFGLKKNDELVTKTFFVNKNNKFIL